MKYTNRSGTKGDSVPSFNRDWALFLDVDGTLLELAERPSDVSAPARLVEVLQSLERRIPLALVSGRRIADLDRLFAPLLLPIAGQHGAERRSAGGELIFQPFSRTHLQVALDTVTQWAASNAGIVIEDKGLSFTLHYRLAPTLKDSASRIVRQAIERAGADYVVAPGNMVWEVRAAGCDKGRVVAAFMDEPPFAGRIPVFIGDDIGDEDGFHSINHRGGHSFKVGPGETAARFRFADVSDVLTWLHRYADWLEDQKEIRSGAAR